MAEAAQAKKIEDAEKKKMLVQKQGEAYKAALEYMKGITQNDQKEVGDYLVTFAAEEAEGMYLPKDGSLSWKEPEEGKNQHLEVAVQDRKDGRFLPHLDIQLKLKDENGKEIGTEKQPFLWHPFLYHYGRNWKIPAKGKYSAEITIKRPEFGRHDEIKGKRYGDSVTVELGPIKLKPGRKPHGPE